MKRLAKLASVGVVGGIIVTLLAVALMAQAPNGGSFSLTNSSACQTPAIGLFSICKPTAGGVAKWTDEGSAYANWPPAGAVGPAGPPGVPGTNGTNGTNGAAATVAVGTTAAGTAPSVTNSGTSSAAVLNFVLQTGPKGDTGLQGPIGVTGMQGVAGVQGPIGPIGPAGTISGPTCITLTTNVSGQLVMTPVACK